MKKTEKSEIFSWKIITANLYIINVIEKLNTVDKIVSWDLHMEAIQHALPNFDAAGHFNYTKSADLYLQSMVDLESTIK